MINIRAKEGGIRDTSHLISVKRRQTQANSTETFRLEERVQGSKSPSKWKIFTGDVDSHRTATVNCVARHIDINRSFLGVANGNARPKAKVVGGISRRSADKARRVRTLMRRWPTLRHVSPRPSEWRPRRKVVPGVRLLVSLPRFNRISLAPWRRLRNLT